MNRMDLCHYVGREAWECAWKMGTLTRDKGGIDAASRQ